MTATGIGAEEVTKPIQDLGPHVAALGMRFYTGEPPTPCPPPPPPPGAPSLPPINHPTSLGSPYDSCVRFIYTALAARQEMCMCTLHKMYGAQCCVAPGRSRPARYPDQQLSVVAVMMPRTHRLIR